MLTCQQFVFDTILLLLSIFLREAIIQNEAKRVTFEEFFEKRLFSSYIVGEGNIYNRMILDYCLTEKDAKQEQDRIEYELLTFEQDLWEY